MNLIIALVLIIGLGYIFGSEPDDVPARLVFDPVLSDYQRKDIS